MFFKESWIILKNREVLSIEISLATVNLSPQTLSSR